MSRICTINARKFLFALPLALLLGFATPSLAYADSGSNNAARSTAVASEGAPLTAEEISNLEALTSASKDDAGPVFDAELAGLLGASDASIVEFSDGFVAAGGRLELPSAGERLAAVNACSGSSGFTGWYWFGPQTAMNSCQTDLLMAGIGTAIAGGGLYMAASALTVAGLPSTAVVGVATAVVAVGLGFLSICKAASSNGAIYLNGGIPGLVSPSCWGQ